VATEDGVPRGREAQSLFVVVINLAVDARAEIVRRRTRYEDQGNVDEIGGVDSACLCVEEFPTPLAE
jgi:hypothetical protein